MFVTNWISTTKIQKYRRLPTFLGTISYPELRYNYGFAEHILQV